MTVKTIMELLNKMDPEARVLLHNRNGKESLFLSSLQNDPSVVWIETEDDADMNAELKGRFEAAEESCMDETEFYQELLETGITVEMVSHYMGDDIGIHMREFCEEHGLM